MKRQFLIILASFMCLSFSQTVEAFSLIQLTNNDYDDYSPYLSDTTVAWYGYLDSSDVYSAEIFTYQGGGINRITNNDWADRLVNVSGNNLSWVAEPRTGQTETEVFFFDGSLVSQITNDQVYDTDPGISSNSVVWRGNGISLYDGSTIIQLADNGDNPEIDGNKVVWEGNGGIMHYDGISSGAVSINDNMQIRPKISGDNIVWEEQTHRPDGNVYGGYEIFYYDGVGVTQLTDDDFRDRYVDIFGNKIVWEKELGAVSEASEIFYFNGTDSKRLTNNNFYETGPQIYDETIVWYGANTYNWTNEIFISDGNEVKQLTQNNFDDYDVRIYGNRAVWQGWDGNDYEIYLAQWDSFDDIPNIKPRNAPPIATNSVPEPATTLLFATGLTGMYIRKRLGV